MLRKIRQVLAVFVWTAVTLLFLDFTGSLHVWLGWLAKIQFLPALLALNAGVVLTLLVLTLLFGRVYCSVICPLGIFQDIISRFSRFRKKKKRRYFYSPALNYLRYTVLVLFVAALLAGLTSFAALLAPYSSYGRIAGNLFVPFWQWGNNLLAYIAERVDSYAFYETEVWIKSLHTFGVALVTLAVIFILAWRNGRTYCNTLCPVGTFLGFFSRFAVFRPSIDADKCRNCRLCETKCKSACIDLKNHRIDYSRCVACMDCLDVCKHDALHFANRFSHKTPVKSVENEETGYSRRTFLTATTAFATGTVIRAQEKKVDGGLATILDKKVPNRSTPILPPGAVSKKHFAQHCTACQLCVSECPNGVLRPSADLLTFMQPEMSYERGYCRPECMRCAEVCPTSAIDLKSLADKSSIQVGHAVLIPSNCVVERDGVSCGNCARHCPTGAIQMVPKNPNEKDSPKLPVVDTERCIGCGACENLCPSRPISAIYVEGHERQRFI